MKKTTTKKILICAALSLSLVGFLFAGENERILQFNGKKIENNERIQFTNKLFKDRFASYELFQFNAADVSKYLAANGKKPSSCILQLGDHKWSLDMVENNVKAENFVMRGLTENGIVEYPDYPNIHTYSGFSNGNIDQTVRLTAGENTIIGMVNDHFGKFIIEPLTRYSSDASLSEYIVFRPEDVITPALPCGNTAVVSTADATGGGHLIERAQASSAIPCHTIDYAMALDYTAFQKMGSPSNAQVILLEMLNVVNLSNEVYAQMQFAPITATSSPHIITFRLVEVFVEQTDANTFNSSMAGGTPGADAILVKFANWVSLGGFKKSYGLATIWTSRGANGNLNDLKSSAAGVSINGMELDPSPNVCHANVPSGIGSPHNIAKWGYFDSWGSMIVYSHEAGHNFSAAHSCAGACAFTAANPGGNTDLMTNSPNPGTWKFIQHEYNAITTGMNDAMGYSICKTCDAVAPIADYITSNGASTTASSCSGNVAFVNRSAGASTWLWNFGDGITSTEKDPVHTYTAKGVYTVSLTATSGTQTTIKTGTAVVNNVTNTAAVTTVGITSTAGTTAPSGVNDKLMYFDVFSPTLLKTVTIPVNVAGYLTVEIYDNNLKTIFKKQVNVIAGSNKVTLNAELATGANYSIGLGKSTIGLVAYRSNTGIAFPYTNSLVSIKKSNNDIFGGSATTNYYFFFNWEVQAITCASDPSGTGLMNLSSNDTFLKVYPIPAVDQLSIELVKNFQKCTIEIYNSLGELVLKNQYQNAGAKKMTFPIHVRAGNYILKLNTEDAVFTEKLIVIE